jgi:hypothetical protein
MTLEIVSGGGASKHVDLYAYLSADDEEQAHVDEYRWIKSLRHMHVDGAPLRGRFTLRGDSLWWFAEIYLHKTQAIYRALRVIAAIDRLIGAEAPRRIRVAADRHAGAIGAATRARGIDYEGPAWPASSAGLRMDARALRLAAEARLSRLRRGAVPPGRAGIAAFVHRAFWKPSAAASGEGGGAESYIGPVLEALEARAGTGAVRYVAVGPRTNFRARRWWDPLSAAADPRVTPIEWFAPSGAMRASRELFRRRHEMRRSLQESEAIRAHAMIAGVDCWPLVRDELAGVALLQFTWSARAMDEAAAALAALAPDVAVTYAEAGGWGRALALEARRAGVPLAGLQHGFIYRHWLNYRHEPDEMQPDGVNAGDRGFPLPAKTLLFDERSAAHLRAAGRFPDEAIAVTGSPRLDELVAAVRALSSADLARVRDETGAGDRPLVVFAAKEREARGALPALVAAVGEQPGIQLAIKPHPAETAEVYAAVAGGAPNIRVLPPPTPLAPLLGAASGLVTVNSTVAIDALALGLPSLVIGLPNNLTPFVEAGAMLGARTAGEIRQGLAGLLYDQMFRSRIERERAAGAGSAAAASAAAILALRH